MPPQSRDRDLVVRNNSLQDLDTYNGGGEIVNHLKQMIQRWMCLIKPNFMAFILQLPNS